MLGVYIPEGFGQSLRPKLAAAQAGTGKITYAVVADSIGQGCYGSTFALGSFAARVGASLRGADLSASDGGSGFTGSAYTKTYLDKLTGAATVSSFYAPELWTLAGTTDIEIPSLSNANFSADGPGAVCLQMAAGATATATVRGTTVTVWGRQLDGNAQTYSIQIDGGAVNSYTTAVAKGIWRQTFSGLAPGAHTVKVTATTPGAANIFYLNGFKGENASGVVVDNYAVSGMASFAYNGVTGNQSAFNGVTTSASSGLYGPAIDWSGGVQNPADVLVYALAWNDADNARLLDRFAHDVNLALYAFRNSGQDKEIAVVVPHLGKAGEGKTFAAGKGYNAEYAARLRALASAYGAAFVNFHEIGQCNSDWWASRGYGSVGKTAPGAVAANVAAWDGAHQSDAGAAFMASTLLPVLQGKVGAQTLPVIR